MSSLAPNGNFVLPLFRQGSNDSQPGEPADTLPQFVPPRESARTDPERAARYPLNLLSPKSHAFLNSSYGNLPRQRRVAGDPYVMIHPKDAAERGIGDGQPVRVFNDPGSFEAAARLTDTVRQGVVVAPLGYWRSASGAAGTVNAVNSPAYADLGRAPTFSDNLVDVAATR